MCIEPNEKDTLTRPQIAKNNLTNLIKVIKQVEILKKS